MSARLIHPFAEQGHFTAVHNLAFDLIMPRVSDSAWKVLCFILRQTVGYNRKSEALSYDDIKVGTGIKGDATIARAIAELAEGEVFKCPLILVQSAAARGSSRRQKNRYAINRKFALALQKLKGETEGSRTSKIEGREKVRTSKIEASRTSKIEGRKTVHIGNARNLTEQSNKQSNSLSTREALENSNDFEPPESPENDTTPTEGKTVDQRPFVQGKNDGRYLSEHFLAICEVCKIDPDLVSWETKSKAAVVATQLSQKYTAEQIREGGRRWELPTIPYPRQILDRLPALLSETAKPKKAAAPLTEFQAQREARRLKRFAKT